MLKPTKGWAHPSPPPSLANAALRRASDDGSEGMAERSHNQFAALGRQSHHNAGTGVSREPNRFVVAAHIEKLFGAADVRN
jgi:hypothetical protein